MTSAQVFASVRRERRRSSSCCATSSNPRSSSRSWASPALGSSPSATSSTPSPRYDAHQPHLALKEAIAMTSRSSAPAATTASTVNGSPAKPSPTSAGTLRSNFNSVCAMRTLITRVGFARGTAAKYSSGAALQRSVGTPNAALTCSTPIGDTPARGSGRRGRRFKSCHPDRIPAGQRPAPEMVRASSLPVQQQNTASTATTTRFDLSVEGLHLASSALRAGRRGRRFNSCHPEPYSRN